MNEKLILESLLIILDGIDIKRLIAYDPITYHNNPIAIISNKKQEIINRLEELKELEK